MKSKSLAQTNKFLKNKAKAKKQVIRSIASSTAIETGESINEIEKKLNHSHSAENPVTLA